jgi:ribosomal protein S18 acetylase RimI-like enzyme
VSDLGVRSAGEDDGRLIDALFRRSHALPADGLGYPRCEDLGEYLAELRLWHRILEDSTFVVTAAGRARGVFGFLYDDDARWAYLAGPMLVPGEDVHLTDVISVAEQLASGRFDELTAAVHVANERLTEGVEARGWTRGELHVQMRRPLMPADRSLPDGDLQVATPEGVRNILTEVLGPERAEAEVRQAAEEGYQVLSAAVDGAGAGTALWKPVEGTRFAVLETLAVMPAHRRRGLGAALVREVIFRAAVGGASDLYLSVVGSNQGARALYASLDFQDDVWRRSFRLRVG